jgi:hypothetical protein
VSKTTPCQLLLLLSVVIVRLVMSLRLLLLHLLEVTRAGGPGAWANIG